MLNDVTLEQDQYQTAELIISAATRGWRLGERPPCWHPRASGESKKGHNVFFALQYARVISAPGSASGADTPPLGAARPDDGVPGR